MLNFIEQEELLRDELMECADETVRIVAALGGQRVGYKRKRRQAMQRMVAEASAPRVTKALKLMPSLELVPGFALDLSGEDDKGHAWDSTRANMREKARALLLKEKLSVLIGSPPCTAFSSWQHLIAARLGWTARDIRKRRAEEEVHVRFCCELCRLQAQAGRFYLYERPANAVSLQLEDVQALLRAEGARQVVSDQCQYGQETGDGQPVKKPTRWLSNSPEIAKMLEKRCRGNAGECTRPGGGSHVVASGQVARKAAVYQFKLCRAILRGCVRQLRADGCLQPGQHGVQGLWEEVADSMISDLEQQIVPEVLSISAWVKSRATQENWFARPMNSI